MYEPGRMNVLETFGQLVNDVLFVKVVQEILFDAIKQIAFHVLKEKIKIKVIVCLDDFFEFDNIFMLG